MTGSLIELCGVCKEYPMGDRRIPVLKGIDLRVEPGEFLAVMGPSGSGKSTLLNIIGTLDRPDSGDYRYQGRSMLHCSDKELSAFRSGTVGFVFQTFNLISGLTVLANVRLPFLYSALSQAEGLRRAVRAVDQVGLSGRSDHKPSELSGGEMQRAAIARAIAINPSLILADEPTGNLDSTTGMEILDLLKNLNSQGVTLLMITHDASVASQARRRIVLKDGAIVGQD
ncbi:MAG: ABC transporter ATP-binding protein [Pseudomonadota bacterium]